MKDGGRRREMGGGGRQKLDKHNNHPIKSGG